jgi:hypothetical protein
VDSVTSPPKGNGDRLVFCKRKRGQTGFLSLAIGMVSGRVFVLGLTVFFDWRQKGGPDFPNFDWILDAEMFLRLLTLL